MFLGFCCYVDIVGAITQIKMAMSVGDRILHVSFTEDTMWHRIAGQRDQGVASTWLSVSNADFKHHVWSYEGIHRFCGSLPE